MTRRWGVAALLASMLVVGPHPAGGQPTAVILATTTSTQDSGLLDVLVPMFERASGHTVKTIAVGTGQALAMAERGEADVVLTHAPSLEQALLASSKVLDRRLVMLNDFVVVGPAADPARVKGAPRAAEAMRRIAETRARFVSRGDRSGTHVLEISLWRQAGVTPQGSWYIESGLGMGQTLAIADDRRGYTLTDRATFLAFERRLALVLLVEGDRGLLNVYSAMRANPANGPRVNAGGGKALADFFVSPAAQAAIGQFGVERFGRPLFVPMAGKTDKDL